MHTHCFLCRKTQNIVKVPFAATKQVFLSNNIIIPNVKHSIKNPFYKDQIAHLKVVSHLSSLELNDLTKLLTSLSTSCDQQIIDSIG